MADQRRVMALITYADTEDITDRMVKSLTSLIPAPPPADAIEPLAPASLLELRMETVLPARHPQVIAPSEQPRAEAVDYLQELAAAA